MTLPSAFDPTAWEQPAERHEVGAAAKFLITTCEPDASDNRAVMLARLLVMGGFTRAELLLAMHRVPFDPRAGHNYGRGLSPSDVGRVVNEHRRLRAALGRVVTEFQMYKLCDEYPEDLTPEHFGCVGEDSDGRKLYRAFRDGRPRKRRPAPEAAVPALPAPGDARTGPVAPPAEPAEGGRFTAAFEAMRGGQAEGSE